MERIVIIVEQIAEAKRLIKVGDLAHLRMALLLLDNASEVLMSRVIRRRMWYRDMHDRATEAARDSMPAEAFEKWKRATASADPMPRQERKAIEREYNPKVDFLTGEDRLMVPMGRVLKAIHRYRNEAYHQDKLRKETIQPAVTVLFDVVADLVTGLKPGVAMSKWGDDYSVFHSRYGIDPRTNILDEGLERIRDTLKADMPVAVAQIAASLADHLAFRLDDMDNDLDFVQENAGGQLSREEQFKRMQLWQDERCLAEGREDPRFQRYSAGRSLADFVRWRASSDALRTMDDKLDLFGAFSALEAEIEPTEDLIGGIAADIDQGIQLAIDIARGK